MKYVWIIFCSFSMYVSAQSASSDILRGNEAYRKGAFEEAIGQYQKALQGGSANAAAYFNLGNALFRNEKPEEAIRQFDAAIPLFDKPADKAMAWYNRGVVLGKSNRLDESIEAYKQALRADPTDRLARENLQRALMERRRRDEEKKKQEERKDSTQQRTDPRQIKRMMSALMEQEKLLQQKQNRSRAGSPGKPEKDW